MRSNCLPPETSSFHAIIAEAPSELSRYDSEIERLEGAIARVRSEQASLESYTDGCRSLFSPARRLPTELLADIFDMCAPPDTHELSDTTTPEEEVDRVAKIYLLQLARVCSRWHRIVMDTPMLWSMIAADTELWDRTTTSPTTLLRLLAASLERGAHFPLSMEIYVNSRRHHSGHEQTLLELLSQHARRWKNVYFYIHPQYFTFLAGAKGNLPLLDQLCLASDVPSYLESPLDVFETAPRLNTVTIFEWRSKLPNLPWGQLLGLEYQTGKSHDLFPILDMMHRIPTGTPYIVDVNVPYIAVPFVLQPTESNLTWLDLRLTPDSGPLHTQTVVGTLLDSLTLPCLRKLRFLQCQDTPAPPLLWPQRHFLSFASRSSLYASLRSLEILAVIEEDELLRCLEVLVSLEFLNVSDCEDSEGHVLVTDNLLHRLAWRNEHTVLIPRIRFLVVNSLLQFHNDSLWDFVTSRISTGLIEKLLDLEEKEDLLVTVGVC
ncbi:hypothetical protein DFH09DRAFT_1324939 [Mycena vulgaris]|nr:hypothetical protein DFH09DRAFT_1324939 [Mycena vulgaris]